VPGHLADVTAERAAARLDRVEESGGPSGRETVSPVPAAVVGAVTMSRVGVGAPFRRLCSMRDATDVLERVPILAGLAPDDLERLAKRLKEVRFAAGDVLVREGTRGARVLSFFVIADGSATVTVDGEPRATLATGEFFGEIGLVLDAARTATVTADTDLRCLALSSWDFRSFVAEYPSVETALAQTTESRLTQ